MIIFLVINSTSISCSTELHGEEKVTLIFGDVESHELLDITKEMADRFNQRTDGRYIIDVRHADDLVLSVGLDAVRTGTIDILNMPLGVFSDIDSRFSLTEIPFLYDDIHTSAAAQELLLPIYSSFMEEEYNQKVFSMVSLPFLQVVSSNKPLTVLEDWQGLSVQSISPTTTKVIEAMGADAIPMSFLDGYYALENEIVDASIIGAPFVHDYKLDEVSDYLTLCNMIPNSLVATINLNTWNSMPDDIKEIFLDESSQFMKEKAETQIRHAELFPEFLADYGMKLLYLDETERNRWRSQLTPYINDAIGKTGEFGEKIISIADSVNDKYH